MATAIKVNVFGVDYESRLKACKAFNQNPGKIDHRLRKGLSLEEALTLKDRYSGAKKHRLYASWNGMRSRCYSKSACSKRYKGRVNVCDEWMKNFWTFVADMDSDFKEGLSIDRIDNEGDYSPSNCRWATRIEQQRNMRSTVFISAFGERMSSMDWQDRYGVKSGVINWRIKNGVNPEDAVSMSRINDIKAHNKIKEEGK